MWDRLNLAFSLAFSDSICALSRRESILGEGSDRDGWKPASRDWRALIGICGPSRKERSQSSDPGHLFSATLPSDSGPFRSLKRLAAECFRKSVCNDFASSVQPDCISELFGHWTYRNDSNILWMYTCVPSRNIWVI